ncbi:ArsR family transcriptional regulator [Sphingobacterium sp. Mn56C]|uniref:ArsR family transcriptional regulator n=1 Tax=Sphingobacterium sp. Mn56C TaxID=3395261 RepID=UPI003BC1EFF0
MLDSLITSKTRLKLLIRFFISAANRGYLRGLAEEFNESTNAIRKELNQLTDAGYLIREEGESKIYYRANKSHALFGSLQGLIHRFLGIEKFVDQIFQRAGSVSQVALVGDYAEGIDSGHVEILVLGDAVNKDYLTQAAKKAEVLLEKKFTVYTSLPEHIKSKIVLFQNSERKGGI